MNTACLALLSAFNTAAPREVQPINCMSTSLTAAGRLSKREPEKPVPTFFSVPRGKLDVGIDIGGMGARIRTATVRSDSDDSYIGIEGESVVVGVEIIEARWTQPDLGFSFNAGMVEDPWISTENSAFRYRTLIEPLSQRNGWMNPSDLGTTLAWTSPKSIITVAGQMTSGEGHRMRERNQGRDTSGLIIVRAPLPKDFRLSATGFYRDGSKGELDVRNHRIGTRLETGWKNVGVGFSYLKAKGAGGRVEREPSAMTGWVNYDGPKNINGVVRFDHSNWGVEGATNHTVLLAVGLGLPLNQNKDVPGGLFVGWKHDRYSASAADLAGAESALKADTIFVQLNFNGRGTSLLDE